MSRYNEDSIKVISIDVEKIKKRPHMYIGYSGNNAALHLCKEIIQNSIDEVRNINVNNKNSKINEIYVEYDEPNKVFTIIDNGRGIPHGSIVDVCTLLQSSGKFEKGEDEAYDFSAGLNGVGLTATTALSNTLVVISKRDGKQARVVFKEGYLEDHKIEPYNSNETGTTVVFNLNEDILGKINITAEPIMKMCNELSYLVKGVKIVFHAIKKGKDSSINTIFYSENGIVDRLDMMAKAKIVKPIYFSDRADNKKIEVALSYNSELDTEEIVSYANFCITTDHGTHVNGFKFGFAGAVTKFVKESLTEKEAKKLNITADDARNGLIAVVNFDHRDPEFVGQVKERLSNEDAFEYVKNVTFRNVYKFLKENPKESKIIVDYVKTVSKLREDTANARKAIIRSSDLNIFSDNRPDGYIPPTGKTNLELIIAEGKSAKGSARDGRYDRSKQGVLPLRGVPLNAYDEPLSRVLQNKEFRSIVTVLGCNIGKDFDINKLRFEKIIILSDNDTDGNRITSLLAGFFLRHMPKLVEAGVIYKAVPPLYSIGKGKNTKYLTDKKSYIDYIERSIAQNTKIFYNGKKMDDDKLKHLLFINRLYLNKLYKLANRLSVDPTLLEYIVYHSNMKKASDIKKVLSKNPKFQFVKVNEKSDGTIYITGLINKEFQSLVLDESFYNKSDKLDNLIHNINKSMLFYNVNGKDMTLGEMLKDFESYHPSHLQRFKGLGEMDSEELKETALSFKNRILYRLTTHDIKKSIEDFAILHGGGPKMIEQRKELLRVFEIDIEDLDT